MKTILLKFLIASYLLLLGGVYGNVHARSGQCAQELVKCAELSSTHYHQAYISRSASHGLNQSFELEATENEVEEDKLIPAKKLSTGSSFFSAVFFALLLSCLPHLFKRGLDLYKDPTPLQSCRRFVLFEVFRI